MSDLSDLIIPSGLVLLGAYAVKRYTENTGQEDFVPIDKTCIGPVCWSTYGPPGPVVQPGPGIVPPSLTPPPGFDFYDPLSYLCTLPGIDVVPPFMVPCMSWRLLHG